MENEILENVLNVQKQPSRGVLRKRCSENMQQIYRRTTKYDFNKVALHFLNNSGKGFFIMKFNRRGGYNDSCYFSRLVMQKIDLVN